MDDDKLSQESESHDSIDSSPEIMAEILSKYHKPVKKEPNLLLYLFLTTLFNYGISWLTDYWFEPYDIILVFILFRMIPVLGAFVFVFIYSCKKELNPFEVFFLSVLPGIAQLFAEMHFIGGGLLTILLLPFSFLFIYVGGFFGYYLGGVIYQSKNSRIFY